MNVNRSYCRSNCTRSHPNNIGMNGSTDLAHGSLISKRTDFSEWCVLPVRGRGSCLTFCLSEWVWHGSDWQSSRSLSFFHRRDDRSPIASSAGVNQGLDKHLSNTACKMPKRRYIPMLGCISSAVNSSLAIGILAIRYGFFLLANLLARALFRNQPEVRRSRAHHVMALAAIFPKCSLWLHARG